MFKLMQSAIKDVMLAYLFEQGFIEGAIASQIASLPSPPPRVTLRIWKWGDRIFASEASKNFFRLTPPLLA